jgi:hypothetical protein
LTIANLEDEPAICTEDVALGDETGDIPIKGETLTVRCTRWISQERHRILKISHRSVELSVLISRDVGWVGCDDIEWPPRGQDLDESRCISYIGVQGKKYILGSIGKWGLTC